MYNFQTICFPGFSIAYTTGSKTTEAESLATLARARELGVTMLDTANAYGFGANEQLLGELSARPVVVCSSYSSVHASRTLWPSACKDMMFNVDAQVVHLILGSQLDISDDCSLVAAA